MSIVLVAFVCFPVPAQECNNTGGISVALLSGVHYNWYDGTVDKTYEFIPSTGFRVAKIFDSHDELFLSVEYSCLSGDPYHNRSDFISSKESELKVIPIKAGARLLCAKKANFRIYLGSGLVFYWMRERSPGLSETRDVKNSGVGLGLNILASSELHFCEDKYAGGLELSLEGRHFEMNNNHFYQEIDMSGWALRGYLSLLL